MKASTKHLLWIVIFSSLFRLFLFFFYPISPWWDSGVYAGMGKFIFSLGHIGFWEHIRPPLLPFLLGFFWFLGFDLELSSFLLEFVFSIGCIVLTYVIADILFSRTVAFLSAIFLAFSPIFVLVGFQTYSEIPALFFILAGTLFFLRNSFIISGVLLGFAFLFKFPSGIFFPLFFSFLFFSKRFTSSINLVLGFVISTSPYFISNYVFFNSFFSPLSDAQLAIKQVLGCNVLNFKSWPFYFYILFFKENILNRFFILGFVFSVFKFRNFLLPILVFIAPFIYFLHLHCREHRYVILFLPFFLFFVAFGIHLLSDELKKYFSKIFLVLFFTYISLSLAFSTHLYFKNLQTDFNYEYVSFLTNKPLNGEVWSSNPFPVKYSDVYLNKIYYPVYNSDLASNFYSYLSQNNSKIQYVFLDNCGGGIICPLYDNYCHNKTKEILYFLDNNFRLVFNESKGRCWYKIYDN